MSRYAVLSLDADISFGPPGVGLERTVQRVDAVDEDMLTVYALSRLGAIASLYIGTDNIVEFVKIGSIHKRSELFTKVGDKVLFLNKKILVSIEEYVPLADP